MLNKLKLGLVALLLPLVAFAQSYPSPTFNNLTINGTFTLNGGLPPGSLAAQAANTVLANVTASSASPTAFAMPSCSATGNALNYTSGTGWTCATGYAPLASPTFTGIPAAPTATFGTNTTQIATTAFVQAAAGTGRLIGVQVFTSSGTYTPTAGANSAIILAVGGGGGGAGTGATSASQVAAGGAGTAGTWGVARITPLASQTVTIGAAGAAGAAGANAGGNGGQTSIGTYLVCPGGGGGTAGTATAFASITVMANPGTQGSAPTSSGTLLYGSQGQVGGLAQWAYNGSGFLPAFGGSGPFGSGGFNSSNNTSGAAGTGNGSGGSGAIAGLSQSAFAGSAGTKGIVIVFEYS